MARIDRLPGAARRVLQWASVVGRIFERRVLESLALLSAYRGDIEGARAAIRQVRQFLQNPVGRTRITHVLLGHTLFHLGHLAEAADAYRQAAAAPDSPVSSDWKTELLAGRARVHLAQAEAQAALACVEELLDRIEACPVLPFTLEPLRIYLTYYRVLRANEDPRADPVLRAAYDLLQEQAARSDDPGLRRSFLENVAAHHEIVATWEKQDL